VGRLGLLQRELARHDRPDPLHRRVWLASDCEREGRPAKSGWAAREPSRSGSPQVRLGNRDPRAMPRAARRAGTAGRRLCLLRRVPITRAVAASGTCGGRLDAPWAREVTLLDVAIQLGLGLLVGTLGTLIGSGGGFLLVSLLVLAYHFPPPDAVGTSLALVFLNALSGTVAYLRQRRVDLSLGWRFAAATVPGAVGGAFLTRALTSARFSLAFGVTLLIIALLLFTGTTTPPSRWAATRTLVDASGAVHAYQVDAWKGMVVSFLVGFFSSILGIGGGVIHVPFLIVALSLPVHIATATSQFVLSISAFVGAVTYLALGHVRLLTTGVMGTGILLGAQVGARLSLRTQGVLIRRVLASSLIVVGLRMIWHALR
jgi:uncharacterized protein